MLNKQTLIDGITHAMSPNPISLEDCIDKWYQAYLNYAKGSVVSYSFYTSTFIGTGNLEDFKTKLTTAFIPKEDPLQTIQQMANAFTSFWQASISDLFNITSEFIPILAIPNPDLSPFLAMTFPVSPPYPTSSEGAITMFSDAIHTYTLGTRISGSYFDTTLPIPSYLPFITNITWQVYIKYDILYIIIGETIMATWDIEEDKNVSKCDGGSVGMTGAPGLGGEFVPPFGMGTAYSSKKKYKVKKRSRKI